MSCFIFIIAVQRRASCNGLYVLSEAVVQERGLDLLTNLHLEARQGAVSSTSSVELLSVDAHDNVSDQAEVSDDNLQYHALLHLVVDNIILDASEVACDTSDSRLLALWEEAEADSSVLLLARVELQSVLLLEAGVSDLASIKLWEGVLLVERWVESLHPSVVKVHVGDSDHFSDLNGRGDSSSEWRDSELDLVELAALSELNLGDLSLQELASLTSLLVSQRGEDWVTVTLVLLLESSVASLVSTLTVADDEAVASSVLSVGDS